MKRHKLLLKSIRHPTQVLTKLYKRLIEQKNPDTKERANFLEFLSTNFDVDTKAIYSEYLNSKFKSWYDSKRFKLIKMIGHSSDTTFNFDCEMLYLLIRDLKPDIVVETGVLYGASSSHILEALKENKNGKLYSIDLPHDSNIPSKGFLVREAVLDRWELIIGDSKALLPKLLNKLKHIDLFFHDSLHAFDHMFWEYHMAFKYLSQGGILSTHDVVNLPFLKNAFLIFCKRYNLNYWIFRNVGIAFYK